MDDKERYLKYVDALAALVNGDYHAVISEVADVEQELLNGIFILRQNGTV